MHWGTAILVSSQRLSDDATTRVARGQVTMQPHEWPEAKWRCNHTMISHLWIWTHIDRNTIAGIVDKNCINVSIHTGAFSTIWGILEEQKFGSAKDMVTIKGKPFISEIFMSFFQQMETLSLWKLPKYGCRKISICDVTSNSLLLAREAA
jgi:hypothetical protein